MNTFFRLLICCSLSTAAIADDTEIYGAAEIDEDKRVNSNVLFIMDTSGSMDGEVAITQNEYVNSTVYSGSYNQDEFYYRTYHSSGSGIKLTQLATSSSTDCTESVTTIATEGRVLGTFKQYRNWNWRGLSGGNDKPVRCDTGNSYWLYSGNYMNWYHDSDNVTTSTRMAVTVDVVKSLTESLSNINLGLMRFDRNSEGGLIDVPVTDVATSGPLIRDELDSYNAQGGTPLEESMHEAARYYRGETWGYGNGASPNSSVSTSRQSIDDQKYKTPITATCQKNHIILLTDGEPTGDTSSNSTIRDLVSGTDFSSAQGLNLNSNCTGNGQCMDELAYWLQNTDQTDDVAGDQPVTTYTIGGFDLAEGVELLQRTAKAGGGQYYEANDTAGLTDALESIFLDILAKDSTFTAPAVSVNAFNSSEHRDDLFYALFRPTDGAKWRGNLKKYKLNNDGKVEDVNKVQAVSDATGFFTDSAKDFWNNTSSSDGQNVTLGGTANLLDASQRRIFSDSTSILMSSYEAVASKTTFDMSAESDTDFTKILNWSIGHDVDNDDGESSTVDRFDIGDPLHSEPVVVAYGGDDDNPDSTIYFGTNEGFIHAIDTESGAEQFAFAPKELHKNQKAFYDNTLAAGSRPYGMDGPISVWMYDLNDNNIILKDDDTVEATDGESEHVYLYAGMRRGGNNYYALDVTDRASPKMLFTIEGGQGDFEKLGQTWSKVATAKVRWNDTDRIVLFFTGGYDTNQDGNTYRDDDDIGNAIYMVDARTGERLWWASNKDADLNIDEMKNSMPASLSLIDIKGDGYVDYLFAADTGGRIFRVDIDPENTGADDFAKGGTIASISEDGATDDAKAANRRFYAKPSVGFVKDNVSGDYLTIAIGTGHRAHPIYTTDVENRFYVFKDYSPHGAPLTYTMRTEASESKTSLGESETANRNNVYNATAIMNQDSSASSMDTILRTGGGWYVILPNDAEKVITQATTFSGAVFFNTFSPTSDRDDEDEASCGADTGQSRFYALDLKNASPALSLEDGASQKLANSGIAPRPVVIYREGGGKSIAIGTETINDERFEEDTPVCEEGDECETDDDIRKCEAGNCYVTPVYWRQNDTDPDAATSGGF